MRQTESPEPAPAGRLFDVVLREVVRDDDIEAAAARVLAVDAAAQAAAARRVESAELGDAAASQSHGWTFAVATLAAVVVVALLLWRPFTKEARVVLPAQEPKSARETKPRDLDHFLELLRSSTALRVRGSSVIGATQVNDADGSYDRLDVERWPEVVRIDGERLQAWRQAIVDSARRLDRATRLGTQLSARFDLPDGSELVASLSAGDEVHLDVLLEPGVVAPNAALRALIGAAHTELELRHRRALGKALDASELAALPADAVHVECPWFADGTTVQRLRRFPELRSLVLQAGERGGPDAAGIGQLAELVTVESLDLPATALADIGSLPLAQLPALRVLAWRGAPCSAVAQMAPNLTELTLEGVALQAADGHWLQQHGRRLRTLRLLDCGLAESGASLAPLIAALPSLAHLTVRERDLPPSLFASLTHSKLQSLRLIDLPAKGRDLAALADLPSLRELAVLGPRIDDGCVDELGRLRQLTTLRLQNVKVTKEGLADLAKALSNCTIDCVPGRRVFDSRMWLRP